MVEEVAGGQIADHRLVGFGGSEVEIVDLLGQGSFAMVTWYLTDCTCFSVIAACRRSPTICCGSYWRLIAVVMISS